MSSDQFNDENEQSNPVAVSAESAVTVKVEPEDPITVANRLRNKYHGLQQGYHAELHSLIQEMFRFGIRLERDFSDYTAVTRQRYFRENKLRPKSPTPMKAAVFSTMTPIAETVKDRACKYTHIMERLRQAEVDEDHIAAFIERCGGVDAILANLSKVRAKESAHSDDCVAGPPPSDSTEGEPDEEETNGVSDEACESELDRPPSSSVVATSELMASSKVVSAEQVLYEALTTGEPPTNNRKRRDKISGDSANNMLVDVGEITMNLARKVAREAQAPQEYVMWVTISPLDDKGFFHARGFFEPKIVDGGVIEQPSINDDITDDLAMPDASEAAGTPAPIPPVALGEVGSRAEDGGTPPSADKTAVEGAPARLSVQGQPPQPAAGARGASVGTGRAPDKPKRNVKNANASAKMEGPLIEEERVNSRSKKLDSKTVSTRASSRGLPN